MPPGLGRPSASLEAFADFFRIDDDLIAVAAECSPPAEEDTWREEIEEWIVALPDKDKTGLLLGLVSGERQHLRAELLGRFRAERRGTVITGPDSRKVAELLDAAEHRAEIRRRKEVERAAREEARREREAAVARERYLQNLAAREPATWDRVDSLIETKRPKDYDEAVGLLKDLMELAVRTKRTDETRARIAKICEVHARKPRFVARLRKAGLTPSD